jgi:hypothetical protein
MAWSFAAVSEVGPSASSALRIVAIPTDEARAKSSARHRKSERAARICALTKGIFTLDIHKYHMIFGISYDR